MADKDGVRSHVYVGVDYFADTFSLQILKTRFKKQSQYPMM